MESEYITNGIPTLLYAKDGSAVFSECQGIIVNYAENKNFRFIDDTGQYAEQEKYTTYGLCLYLSNKHLYNMWDDNSAIAIDGHELMSAEELILILSKWELMT